MFWKFQLFKQFNVLAASAASLVLDKSIPKLVNRIHPKTKKRTQSLRFFFFYKSMFKTQRLWFYPSVNNGKKVIPANFAEYCDAACLAVWFMDDGGRGANTPLGLVLDVSSYSVADVSNIISILLAKHNIVTSVHRLQFGPRATKLYIKRESAETFCELIRPYTPQFMLYKLVC